MTSPLHNCLMGHLIVKPKWKSLPTGAMLCLLRKSIVCQLQKIVGFNYYYYYCFISFVHHRTIKLSVNLHRFNICYWMSFAKQHGSELLADAFVLHLCNDLTLVPIDDGLSHRPAANWTVRYLCCDLTRRTDVATECAVGKWRGNGQWWMIIEVLKS